MAHNICLIDDRIPLGDEKLFIDDRGRLNSSNIELLLNQQDLEWEEAVKELLTELTKDKNSWSVSAFKNPNLYLNNFDREYYLPDFIIFDWDYDITDEPTEVLLKKVLEKSFSLISIYARQDEEEVVRKIIEESFKEYKNRINIIFKSDNDSIQQLINWASERLKDNFAFKFSRDLRYINRNSLEHILVEFGKPSLNDIVWLFGDEEENQERVLHSKELSDIIVEKLRSELLATYIGDQLKPVSKDYNVDSSEEMIRKMWSYRLFYGPKDDVVRKGDIIRKKDSGANTLYLVISSDCHLKHFWKSNFGHLALVPIYQIHKKNYGLIEKLDLFKAKGELKKSDKPTSLTNWRALGGGPIIIPCLPINDEYADYLLFPKEVFSFSVPLPQTIEVSKRSMKLKYEYIKDYEGNNRFSITEQFITPLIEHILYNISGYGVPDFPNSLQEIINKNYKDIF